VTTPPPPSRVDGRRSSGAGLVFVLAAYVLWGLLPVYFVQVGAASPFEIVGWRILFSLVFCALLIVVTRSGRSFLALLRDRRVLGALALAGVFIYVNWQVYVVASTSGHIVEASLGYFINPIVTVLLGVLVLRERLRPAQWAAVGVSLLAVLVIAIGYGSFPWIALALACSFGIYGLIKKRVGDRVDAIGGLTIETMWLAPVAVVQLVVVGAAADGLAIASGGAALAWLLAASGVITAVPLLLFAAGARRLPLVTLGLSQYIAPVMQLIVGVVVMGEDMPLGRWLGFGLVWAALVVLTVDMIASGRRARRAGVEPV
jgi:chloramphenicol-sensitive protein RarD